MIDREDPAAEYSPFVALPSQRGRRHAAMPFVERQHSDAFESLEHPDLPATEDVEAKHYDCTTSGDGIHGADDRVAVSNTAEIPCRWICQLFIRSRTSEGIVVESGATGVLISPRHVLTVAHAICGSSRNSRNQLVTTDAFDVRVTPARDGGDRPFGTVGATLPAMLPAQWSQRAMPPHYDYAVLTLDKRIGDEMFKRLGGAKLCYWGSLTCGHKSLAARVPPESLEGVTAFTAGYPKDRGNAESLFRTSGVLSSVRPTQRLMLYSADACQGQSGSPVWVNVDGERRLVGMLIRVTPTTTLTLRMTREFVRDIRKWLGRESDAFTTEVSVPKAAAAGEAEWDVAEASPELSESEGEGSWQVGGGATDARGERDAESWESGEQEWTHESAVNDSEADVATEGDRRDAEETPTGDQPTAESEVNAPVHLRMQKWSPGAAESAQRESESEFEHAPDSESDESLEPEQQLPPVRPRLSRMAFLARFVGPLDPGFYNAAGNYVSTPALQTCVNTVKALPAARGMQFAIVDFTKGVASPEFAGVRHTEATAIGSVGKIMAMYAAFQLQNDLRVLKVAAAPANLAALITALEAQWTTAQVLPVAPAITPFAGDIGRRGDVMTWKGRPLDVPGGTLLPDVRAMFRTFSTLNFDSSRQSFVPGASGACDEAAVLVATEHMSGSTWRFDLPFLQRMRMMIGLSDNRASGSCIDDIGLAYINALLVQSGLWHPARNGGLWLAGNYAGKLWRKSPLGGFTGNGTAGSLAAFLTLLVRQRLVSVGASTEMRAMLDKNTYFGALTRSPVEGALRNAGRASHVWSKLGLLEGRKVFDAAIVERTEGGKALKYAVVILNSVTDAPLATVAVALDDCIRRNNGLP